MEEEIKEKALKEPGKSYKNQKEIIKSVATIMKNQLSKSLIGESKKDNVFIALKTIKESLSK